MFFDGTRIARIFSDGDADFADNPRSVIRIRVIRIP
jgi:hypothetical protein